MLAGCNERRKLLVHSLRPPMLPPDIISRRSVRSLCTRCRHVTKTAVKWEARVLLVRNKLCGAAERARGCGPRMSAGLQLAFVATALYMAGAFERGERKMQLASRVRARVHSWLMRVG